MHELFSFFLFSVAFSNEGHSHAGSTRSVDLYNVERYFCSTSFSMEGRGRSDAGSGNSPFETSSKAPHRHTNPASVEVSQDFNQHRCHLCPYTTMRGFELTRHIRIHTGEKPYKCDTCSRTFSQQGNLIRHVRTHTAGKLFKCSICSCRFSQESSLANHMYIHSSM